MPIWPRWLTRAASFLGSEEGQAMVEYALILCLVVIVVVVLVMLLGNQVKNLYCNITGAVGA